MATTNATHKREKKKGKNKGRMTMVAQKKQIENKNTVQRGGWGSYD